MGDSMKLGGTVSRLIAEHRYTHGTVLTDYGIVDVQQEDTDYLRYYRLDFVRNGRLYMRTVRNKTLTRVGLARVSSKFAREIVEGK